MPAAVTKFAQPEVSGPKLKAPDPPPAPVLKNPDVGLVVELKKPGPAGDVQQGDSDRADATRRTDEDGRVESADDEGRGLVVGEPDVDRADGHRAEVGAEADLVDGADGRADSDDHRGR